MRKEKRKSEVDQLVDAPLSEDGTAESSVEEAPGSEHTGGEQNAASEELEELKSERDEAREALLRLRAEFENYRRRVVREKEMAHQEGQAQVVKELLSVIDVCRKGLESMPPAEPESELAPYRQGYELLLKQLQDLLRRFNIEEAPGVGVQFDPNFHEAVVREETDQHEEGEILEEYRKGYLIGNRLLRPSQVKVAVRPEEMT